MFNWIRSKLKFAQQNKQQQHHNTSSQHTNNLKAMKTSISLDLHQNHEYLQQKFAENYDIKFRKFSIGEPAICDAFIVYVAGLYNITLLNDNILNPLMGLQHDSTASNLIDLPQHLVNHVIHIEDYQFESTMELAIQQLLRGHVLLFFNGYPQICILDIRTWDSRSIDEPITESTIRGPREGFVETLNINTAMLRRRLHHPEFIIQSIHLGTRSDTEVLICYLRDIAPPELVKEVKTRLSRIHIEAILESGYIEQFIEDSSLSPFPTVANTERPDVVIGRLLEGRVAILVEGSSSVLIVPHLLFESFQTPEDYYSRPYYASLLRISRLFGFLFTTLFPAVYVAVQQYDLELLPTDLLISIAADREGVPFPVAIEVFVLLVIFEFLKEAGLRMPRTIGQAVSIVGALVLGEAAVAANLVAAPTVIVVALTAITGFMVMGLLDAAAVLRLLYLIAAATFGIYGIAIIITLALLHVAALRSFAIPYSAPWFPLTWTDWKDHFIRAPLWMMDKRPSVLHPQDIYRQAEHQKPAPPEDSRKK